MKNKINSKWFCSHTHNVQVRQEFFKQTYKRVSLRRRIFWGSRLSVGRIFALREKKKHVEQFNARYASF